MIPASSAAGRPGGEKRLVQARFAVASTEFHRYASSRQVGLSSLAERTTPREPPAMPCCSDGAGYRRAPAAGCGVTEMMLAVVTSPRRMVALMLR